MSLLYTDQFMDVTMEKLPTALRARLSSRLLPENGLKRTFKKAIFAFYGLYREVEVFERQVISHYVFTQMQQRTIDPVPIIWCDHTERIPASVTFRKVYYPNGTSTTWERGLMLNKISSA